MRISVTSIHFMNDERELYGVNKVIKIKIRRSSLFVI